MLNETALILIYLDVNPFCMTHLRYPIDKHDGSSLEFLKYMHQQSQLCMVSNAMV